MAPAALIDAVPPFEYSASFPTGYSLDATVVAGVVGYCYCSTAGQSS